ncbi:ADP-ribosylarginine hydrolase CG2909-like [Haematobia irritans]|uniref:ADP-ribosylarginine hydrolase CG2909-like n=1 Tax=Haematobia irritans TaxID=7368 RepID=UPI003F4FF0CC
MSIFGSEFEMIWPKAGSVLKLTDFGKNLMKQCKDIRKPQQKAVDINEFKRKSSNFPLEFGINTCRVMSQPIDRYSNIGKQISSAYPVIHERVLQLYLDFLEHKCQYGYSLEQELYGGMTLTNFVQRLLDKRCVLFVGGNDSYILLNGQKGIGYEDYPKIGKPMEKDPLVLRKCLSYDEVKLSAFLSISSLTELINDGNRFNAGVIEKDLTKIEREGLVIGLIGARFERPLFMDYQDIVISHEQNKLENGYGYVENYNLSNIKDFDLKRKIDYRRIWNNFYQEKDYVYTSIPNDSQRFFAIEADNPITFDNVLMKKRYAISFDTLLLEAQDRAAKCNQQAYVHVVGIGLGVWKMVSHQNHIFLETFSQRVRHLLPNLNNIGVLHFSWFHTTEWKDLKDQGLIASQSHPLGGIKIFMSNRNPADKLKDDYANMLLVISYAWDGNALPGNEFWAGSLCGSNDPSTACSTLITELHNPHINCEWVCGDNLHIATSEYGIIHISDYVNKKSHQL